MHLSTRLVLDALLLAFTNPSALAFFTNDTLLVSKNTTVTPSSVPLEPSDTPSFSKNASLKLSGTLFNSSKKASSKLSGTLFNSSNIVGHSVANTSITSTNETSKFLKQSTKSVYYVWPINSTNKLGNEAILNFFQKELGLVLDEIPVSRLGSDLSSVNFFTVELTADEAGMVANSTERPSVIKQADSLEGVHYGGGQASDNSTGYAKIRKRAPLVTKYGQREEIVFISQPRMATGGWGRNQLGWPLNQLDDMYRYDRSAGSGALVYVVDTGADYGNPEFDNIRGFWRWAGPDYTRTLNQVNYPNANPAAHTSHGTGMVSKVAGAAFGVAKKANVIVVQLAKSLYTIEDVVDALSWTINDWIAKRENAKVKVATINMSWGFNNWPEAPDEFFTALDRFEELLVLAIQNGILPMCAAGNEQGPVRGYPALFLSPRDYDGNARVPPTAKMLVIGGVDNDGKLAQTMCSTAPWVQLNAPAINVKVAELNAEPTTHSGTSLACAAVVGVAAYRSALGNYATVQGTWEDGVTALRREIMSLAYPRVAGDLYNYPLAIWNGVNSVNDHCGTYRGNYVTYGKRDLSSDECSSPSASDSSSTTTSTTVVPTSTASSPSPSASSLNANIFTNVTVANSSIILGYNQTDLLTTIASQLEEQCPNNANTCNEYGYIDNIYSYVPGLNQVKLGDLTIKIPESLYNSATQLAGMITLAAKAMSNSGSYCNYYDHQTGNCFGRREVTGTDPCENQEVYVCHYTDSVDVVVSGSTGLLAQMQIEFVFDFPGAALMCEEIVELVDLDTVAMALFPELEPVLAELREDLGLAETWCNDINKEVSWLTGGSDDG